MSEDNDILIEKVRELEAAKPKVVTSWPEDPNNTAAILKENRYLSQPMAPEEAKRQMFAKSRRGFLVGGVAALAGILGWRWISPETKSALYRRTFEFNERVSQMFYSPKRLASEFPLERVTMPARFNGAEGLAEEVDLAAWRLTVGGLAGRTDDLVLTIDDVKRLPRTEMITEFKCIEGWSTIVHWAGVRFSDFITAYAPRNRDGSLADAVNKPQDLPRYVSMMTPDEQYYVGWDMPSILHPQTLLAYEMNGAPLTNEHGAPLRLASPTKYGIKQIKRIGRIDFTDDRPKDFWAEFDYDWYSGH